MVVKLRVDSYEAGRGAVGGLATFHNNLYPRLQKRGFEVKTFSMRIREDLPPRENYHGVIIRRSPVEVDIDTAYAWTYDILHQYGIDVDYLTSFHVGAVPRYFTNFAAIPSPYRMAHCDVFSPHDWMSYLRSALNAWLHPGLVQVLFLHSTECGRSGGIGHNNIRGTSERLSLDDFSLNVEGDFQGSFFSGSRLIRDLEFSLTYRILGRNPYAALFTVSRLHRNEYFLGLRAHGVKFGDISKRVFAVYHGVDSKEYRPRNDRGQGFRIGFIGRCSPTKGVDIIPSLALILRERIPGIKFQIVTKADPQNPYYQNLCRQIHDNGLENTVEIDNTFYVGDEKVNVISSWDVLLCPSRYEPQGQVDLEAMACGVIPAVGLGGLREKTADGFNGVWVNPYDIGETVEKLYSLYKGEYAGRKTEEIHRNAREAAEKIWDWEKRVEVHKELYTYLVDGRIDSIEGDLGELLLPSPTDL